MQLFITICMIYDSVIIVTKFLSIVSDIIIFIIIIFLEAPLISQIVIIIELFLLFNWFVCLWIFIIMSMALSWISRYVIWARIHTIFWIRLDFVWLRCIIWLAVSWYFICCPSIHIIWIRRRPWIYILSWDISIVTRQLIISVRQWVFIIYYTSIFLRLYYVFFIFLVFMRVWLSFLKVITTLWKMLI